MNVEEFKKLKPEYKEVEGDQLWNAMEDYMLRQQSGQEVMKTTVPFFKRYQLRWLFYRRLPNMVWGENNYTSSDRCSNCKKGVSGSFGYIFQGKMFMHCPHCGKDLKKEKNTNLNHKLWVIGKNISILFWNFLDKIHLVRSQVSGRYDMMGDECKYVKHWTMNYETGKMSFTPKKRKWWEYIFIERSRFNF